MANMLELPVIKDFLSLFENARKLAITHHKRSLASDVLYATKLYLDSQNVKYDEGMINVLVDALKDKNIRALQEEFDIAGKSILSSIIAQSQANHGSANN